MLSRDHIQRLPKTDLHLHLDGSLRPQTILELADEQGVTLPANDVDRLVEKVFPTTYRSLRDYLAAFQVTTAVLQTPDALSRAAFELAEDCWEEGVRYIEVRFAPHLHMGAGLDFDVVVEAVNDGLHRAARQINALHDQGPRFHYGIIVCAMRMFEPAHSAWYAKFEEVFDGAPRRRVYGLASMEAARAAVRCRDQRDIPIVGFDLAGQEDGFPAHDHSEAYAYCAKHFLHRTVHAGEAYGPESIYQAITDLHADRIGHGYHLFSADLCGAEVDDGMAYVQRLSRYVADRRITLEVCLTSNLQTNPGIGRMEHHNFGRMLSERLSATLCTDNRLVSHTTVTDEIIKAVDAFGMTPTQLRSMLIHGFKRSFFWGSYADKRAYVREVIDAIDAEFAA